MTTYTAIPDASLEPGKPARSVDAILLRDNPLSIAEGDPTAPSIGGGIAAVAHSQIGSHVLAVRTNSPSVNFGTTVAGSQLTPVGFITNNDVGVYPSFSASLLSNIRLSKSGSVLTGTWRCLGVSVYGGSAVSTQITLWIRIL